MDRAEIEHGLKAGRMLCVDGWATDEVKQIIRDLVGEGPVTAELVEGDQYSFVKVKWGAPKPDKETT